MAVKLVSSPLSLRLSPSCFGSHFVQKELKIFKRVWKTNCVTRPLITSSPAEISDGLRVFVVSDLHTDYPENMKWVSCLSTVNHKDDVLIVAGDVSETYKNFLMTMSLLKDRFEHVFFVPGNHDLWCRRDSEDYVDSLEKLNKLMDACKSIGVQTNPLVIGNLGIIPLFSWYHESFDTEDDITSIHIPPLEMACKDYHVCRWPDGLYNGNMSLAYHFDALNNPNEDMIDDMKKSCSHIITFSHFVPRQELCPEKRMLLYPNLPKIIGSDILEHRLRTVHGPKGCPDSSCHVFGHTHFCWDSVVDGIRYVQAPLAYPRERKRSMNGGEHWLPFCIYSDGGLTGRISRRDWSDYYDSNARDPQNTEPAPWVAKYYRRRKS